MKNICFFIGNLNLSGGTERVTTLIANGLVEKGFNVFILNLNNGLNPFFKLDERIKVSTLYPEMVSMKTHFFDAVFKIRKFVEKNKIQTIIDVDSILSVFSVAALFGLSVKHICWEHFYFKADLGSFFRVIGRRLAALCCDCVVTLTEKDKYLWESSLKIRRAKILSIINPSPYKDIKNIPDKENKIILAIGRLTYSKGFDLLLKAWMNIYCIYPEWNLFIVGEGEERDKLEKFINENNIKNVHLPGKTQDVEEYYKKASFFCLSSRFEGLGMVLIEAQTYGLPIISFDCEVGPSEIIRDNVDGFLVENGNVEKLRKKLEEFMTINKDEYINFSNNATSRAKNYSIDSVVEKWLKII